MLFSIFGEIGLITIGTLWVINQWFDSCINLIDVLNKNNDGDKEPPLTEAAKRMYS